jgi:hypothetical protein
MRRSTHTRHRSTAASTWCSGVNDATVDWADDTTRSIVNLIFCGATQRVAYATTRSVTACVVFREQLQFHRALPIQRVNPTSVAAAEDMDVERQVVSSAELREEAEVVLGNTLRCGVADGDVQPSIRRAMPGLVKPVVEARQFAQRGDPDRLNLGANIGGQEFR